MTLLSKDRQDLWQKRFQWAPFVPCATRPYSTQRHQSTWARPSTTVRTDERTRGSLAGSSWTQNNTSRSKTVSRWWARPCEVGQRKEGQRTLLGAALGKPILAWSLLCRYQGCYWVCSKLLLLRQPIRALIWCQNLLGLAENENNSAHILQFLSLSLFTSKQSPEQSSSLPARVSLCLVFSLWQFMHFLLPLNVFHWTMFSHFFPK